MIVPLATTPLCTSAGPGRAFARTSTSIVKRQLRRIRTSRSNNELGGGPLKQQQQLVGEGMTATRSGIRQRSSKAKRWWPTLSKSSTAGTNISSSTGSGMLTGQRHKATMAAEGTIMGSLSSSSSAQSASAGERHLGKELIAILGQILGKPRTIPIPRWVSPKHYSITLSECLGHSSFILVATSYAVDDFLMLRVIAVAGSTAMLFFTYFHPHGRVLWLPFKWNCLFIALNSYRIGKVWWDRMLSEQLSPELLHTRSTQFSLMDPVDFSRLTRLGTIEAYRKGDVLVDQGKPNKYVRVVLSGSLRVLRDGKLTYQLTQGNFVAESGLHAGLMLTDSVESCCTIQAESDVRVLSWDRSELIDLLERREGLRRSLKGVLSHDIINKLKAQRLMLAHHAIDDPDEWTRLRHDQTNHRYASILKNLLSSNPSDMERRKKELNKYRTMHHIDDEHHRQALEACGWTIEEYERGHKDEIPSEKDVRSRRHGVDWYVREFFYRMVG